MDDPSLPLTGRCMCGGVRFEISAPLVSAAYCHCTRCRRRTGTGASIGAQTVPGSLEMTTGQELVRTWDPGGGGWVKAFCGECGSQLYSSSPDGERRSVRMGALDSDPGIRAGLHQFVAYAPAWAPVPDDGLPRFDERAPAPGAAAT